MHIFSQIFCKVFDIFTAGVVVEKDNEVKRKMILGRAVRKLISYPRENL